MTPTYSPLVTLSGSRRVRVTSAFAVCALSSACSSSMVLDPTFAGQVSSDLVTSSGMSSTTSEGDAPPDTSSTGNSGEGDSGEPECGNGVLEPGELCDDGNAVETDACTATCVPATCGDGLVEATHEECDEGELNGPDRRCRDTCELNVCGDGDRGPDEACDDGNTDDTDACTSSCALATCGDGLVREPFESCDEQGDAGTCDGDCTPAHCGDGYTNRAAGEECDDGNTSSLDNCYPSCKAPTMWVFITSEAYQGDLGGLAGADAKCQSLAEKAGIVGTFKAWLSTPDEPVTSRLYHSPGRYRRLDGVVVADNFAALMDGPMYADVTITETKQDIDDPIYGASFWSGEGGFSDPGDGYCQDWTSSSWDDVGGITATYASGYEMNDTCCAWTNCYSTMMPLLCVQQAWYPEDPTPP